MAISNADYAREAAEAALLSKAFNPATSVPAGEAGASHQTPPNLTSPLPPMNLLFELSAFLALTSSASASPATTAPRLSGRSRRLLVHTPPSPHGLASNFARAVFPDAAFFAAASVPGYTVPSLLDGAPVGAPVGAADRSAAGDTEGADGVAGGCFDVAVVTYDHDPPPCSHSYIFLNGEGGYPGHLPPHSLVLGPPFSTVGTATHLWVPYASTSFAERLDTAPAFRRAVAARQTRRRTGKGMRRGRREDKDVTPKKRLSSPSLSSPPPPPRRRFAVYLSSRCFGHREAFFDALHARATQVRRGCDAG